MGAYVKFNGLAGVPGQNPLEDAAALLVELDGLE
jgi:hypothetical protein